MKKKKKGRVQGNQPGGREELQLGGREVKAASFPAACREPGRSVVTRMSPGLASPQGACPQLRGLWAFLAVAVLKGTAVSHSSRWQHRLLSLSGAQSVEAPYYYYYYYCYRVFS